MEANHPVVANMCGIIYDLLPRESLTHDLYCTWALKAVNHYYVNMNHYHKEYTEVLHQLYCLFFDLTFPFPRLSPILSNFVQVWTFFPLSAVLSWASLASPTCGILVRWEETWPLPCDNAAFMMVQSSFVLREYGRQQWVVPASHHSLTPSLPPSLLAFFYLCVFYQRRIVFLDTIAAALH